MQPPAPAWAALASAVFLWCAWSDVADGRLARRRGSAGPVGRWLDHGSDLAVLLAGFLAFVARGALPWWVPAAIGCAFAAYVLEEVQGRSSPKSCMASRVGHWGGIANYVLLGVLIGQFTVQLEVLPAWFLFSLYLSVPLYSGAAIFLRIYERGRSDPTLAAPARS